MEIYKGAIFDLLKINPRACMRLPIVGNKLLSVPAIFVKILLSIMLAKQIFHLGVCCNTLYKTPRPFL
jgi:hypothetical protein